MLGAVIRLAPEGLGQGIINFVVKVIGRFGYVALTSNVAQIFSQGQIKLTCYQFCSL